jgi:small subunit ribosomal protein S24e
MEIRIVEERTNPLLKRHELRFEVAHATESTPTRDHVRTELAKSVHASKDRVIIERMNPRFGTAVTRGEANVYDTAAAALSISREHILVRNGLKEKAAKAGAPAAATPEAPKPPSAPEAAPAEPAPPAAPAPSPPAPADEAKPPKGAEPAAADAPKRPKAHAKKE